MYPVMYSKRKDKRARVNMSARVLRKRKLTKIVVVVCDTIAQSLVVRFEKASGFRSEYFASNHMQLVSVARVSHQTQMTENDGKVMRS